MSKRVLIRVTLALCLCAVLLAVPLVTACQGGSTPTTTPTTAPTTAPTTTPTTTPTTAPTTSVQLPDNVVFQQSGTGKGYGLLAYISEMVTKYTPMTGAVEKVTSPAQALQQVIAGESAGCIYAVPSPITALDDAQKAQLRALYCGGGATAATIYAMMTTPDSGVKTVADLKGKDFYAEKPSITFFAPTVEAILAANGLSRDDLNWRQYDSGADAFRDLSEGRVAAVFYVGGSDSTALGESSVGMYVVPFDEATQQAAADLGFGLQGMTWPAGAFGNKTDTPVLGSPNVHWVSTAMSDDVAYAITKAVWDNIAELQASQKAGEGFNADNAFLQWDFPYHPGAIKYFKEAGMWTSEYDAKQAALIAKYGG